MVAKTFACDFVVSIINTIIVSRYHVAPPAFSITRREQAFSGPATITSCMSSIACDRRSALARQKLCLDGLLHRRAVTHPMLVSGTHE